MARSSVAIPIGAVLLAGVYFAAFSGVGAYLPALLDGLAVTLRVAVPSALLSYLFAVVAGLGRLSSNRILRLGAAVYVELFRGVSLLVILFWLFFVLPEFGVTLSPYLAALLGISLNAGAYGAEIVRGAVGAVPKGQFEACTSLNMPDWQKYSRIILPQALVIAIPAMTNMTIELLKGTALVSAVTLVDLTAAGVRQNQLTYRTLEIFSVLALVYYCLAQVVQFGGLRLERAFGRHLDPGAA